MQKLYEITIPGLSMKVDLPDVRHRLLADFPKVVAVLAMTTPATLLIAYHGEQEVDAWLDAISESVATRPHRFPPRPRPPKALCRTRTDDPFLTMEVLYQLS
jgi:hypothetical protein